VVWPRESRSARWIICRNHLRGAESRRDSRGRYHIALAVFSAVRSFRDHRFDDAISGRNPGRYPCGICDNRIGSARWSSRGHVELHGLGQRLHDCPGSGKTAADLSQGHDCGGDPGFVDLRFAISGCLFHGHSFLRVCW